MKLQKVKLTILGVAILLCCRVSQSAEIEIGCELREYTETSNAYINLITSIGEFNQDDFTNKKGQITVATTISGNDKSWTVNGAGNYVKNDNRLEFRGKWLEIPMKMNILKEEFGIFVNINCKAIY